MDPSRFDDFARSLSMSRRSALRTLVGGAAAGFALLVNGASAAKDKRFFRAKKLCSHGQPCGELAPCTNGVCLPKACLIRGVVYNFGDTNPDNPCESCRPTLDYQGWSNR